MRRLAGVTCAAVVLIAAGFALVRTEGARDVREGLARQASGTTGSASGTASSTARRAFVGDTYVTANGASVAVRVSEAYPDAVERGRRWAEFFSLLPHGDELAGVQISVITGPELAGACGERALGCYRPGDLTFADEVLGGVAPDEVARHEYGHHVAANRSNPPWRSLDWGPKRWASAAGVCAGVKDGTLFPGNEGSHYSENPAEIWAEVYRIFAERSAGLPGSLWPIVVGRFYPDDVMLAAAREDVLNPWTTGTSSRYAGRFVKRGAKVWQRAVKTPRDGTIIVTLGMPAGPRHSVELVAADGRTVLSKWTGWTTRSRTIETTVCGQRSVFVRVTRGNAPTSFTVSVSTP